MKKSVPTYMQLGYVDACIEQTLLWINGKSEHRNNECTVDFSCCFPALLFNDEKRLSRGSRKLNELHERRKVILSSEGEDFDRPATE